MSVCVFQPASASRVRNVPPFRGLKLTMPHDPRSKPGRIAATASTNRAGVEPNMGPSTF
jgi:hypothetical protein